MPFPHQNNLFVALNLPPRELRLGRDARGMLTVYDPLRHKFVVLTPEEWVRQHFVAHLVGDLGYPAALTANEVSLSLNGLQRRCDTLVWSSDSGQPLVVVEYKAPSVNLSRRVFDQIVRYNLTLRAPYLFVSNGLTHCCCRVDCQTGSYTALPSISPYSSL